MTSRDEAVAKQLDVAILTCVNAMPENLREKLAEKYPAGADTQDLVDFLFELVHDDWKRVREERQELNAVDAWRVVSLAFSTSVVPKAAPALTVLGLLMLLGLDTRSLG